MTFYMHLDHGAAEDRLSALVESCLEEALRTRFHAQYTVKDLDYEKCFTVQTSTVARRRMTDVSNGGRSCFMEIRATDCGIRTRWSRPGEALSYLSGRSEHTKLGYELTEYALLFLRSNWLRDICSCSIWRLIRATFAINVHCTDHVRQSGLSRCETWCAQRSIDGPAWRLGLVLLQMALDREIVRIDRDMARSDRHHDLQTRTVINLSKDDDARSYAVYDDGLDDELLLELQGICEDLAETIDVCLTFKFEDFEDDAAAFAYFYEAAVFP